MKNVPSRLTPLSMLAIGAIALTGCLFDSKDKEHHHDEDPWVHACVHTQQSPIPVTASDVDSLAGDVSDFHHEFFHVAVSDSGVVKFTPDEHGDFAILLTVDVPFAVFTSAGTPVEIEETVVGLEGCPELAVMHVVDLDDEKTYFLSFGRTAETTVGLIIEELDHHDDD